MTSAGDGPPLVVVGASVRAFASSAARAGFRVFAADLFGDHDLRAIAAEVRTINPYPEGLPAAIAHFPRAPVIYTGALENHPTIIARLAADRPLAASPPESLRHVRDPEFLAHAVREAGLGFPDTCRAPTGLPDDGSWLVKPTASAGGHGIVPWRGQVQGASPRIWQRRIAGTRLSVGFALGQAAPRLVSMSRQLIGRRWCRSDSFVYCGSIDCDPEPLATSLGDQLTRLRDVLAVRFGLVGLVGADLILDSSQRLWVIEINPRPTASMELTERATGLSLAALQLAPFTVPCPRTTERWPRDGTWAKAVLFAARDIVFNAEALAAVESLARPWTATDGWPAVADIPEPACPIPKGAPVCTVFAHERSPRAAIQHLRRRAAAIEAVTLG